MTRRILVLGSSPHNNATSYDWSAVPPALSVADFEVVVLNLVPAQAASAERLPPHAPSREQFARLIFSDQSHLIVIGSPVVPMRDTNSNQVSPTWFLPVILDGKLERGSAMDVADTEWKPYFSMVEAWSWYARNGFDYSVDPVTCAKYVRHNGGGISLVQAALATTRFGESIALDLRFELLMSGTADKIPGRVTWLPEPTTTPVRDAIDHLLATNVLGVTPAEVPSWASQYVLPNETVAASELAQAEMLLEQAQSRVEVANSRLSEETRFRSLLFETGPMLEATVRDALSVLGLSVEVRPPNKEDARASRGGMEFIVEIKGRRGAAQLQDVRQLQDWVSDAIASEDWTGRGVLIANTFSEQDPTKRANSFPENTIRTATRFGLALMTTYDLFEALRAHQESRFHPDEFWKRVFDTTGVFRPGA